MKARVHLFHDDGNKTTVDGELGESGSAEVVLLRGDNITYNIRPGASACIVEIYDDILESEDNRGNR